APGNVSDNGQVYGRRFDSLGHLDNFFNVTTYTTGTKTGARVASDASGNFVVVWSNDVQDGSGNGVFAQRYLYGGSGLGERRVNTVTTGDQREPAIAMDAAGGFVVVWQSGPLPRGTCCPQIIGQRFSSSGSALGTEFQASVNVGNYVPDVASDASGNFVIV